MTSTQQKCEWLVICPDHVGVLESRMKVRQAHLDGTKETQNIFWKMGGGMLEEAAKQGEKLKLNGSAFIAVAESKEEVLEVLRKDVYAESGIWDMSKVQIIPFKCAFRYPL